jgi:Domain of unknown function (DUF4845)
MCWSGCTLCEGPVKTRMESSLKARHAEQGGAGLKAVLSIVVLVILVYVGFKVVPPYMDEYQLHDKMVTEARFATVNRRTDEELRDIIFKEIQDLEIPAKREDIAIENTRRSVKISVEYTVPVDLIFYRTELHFNPAVENRSVL